MFGFSKKEREAMRLAKAQAQYMEALNSLRILEETGILDAIKASGKHPEYRVDEVRYFLRTEGEFLAESLNINWIKEVEAYNANAHSARIYLKLLREEFPEFVK